MTVVFAGGELDAFRFVGNVIISTDASRFDSNFARQAIVPRPPGAFLQADFTPLTEGWLHLNINVATIGGFGNQQESFVQLIDTASSQAVVLIDVDGINFVTADFNLEFFNGATFTEVFPTLPLIPGTTHIVDIHWKIAATGFFRAYVDSVLISSFEGTTTGLGFTQIDQLKLTNMGTAFNQDAFYSEVIVSTEETLGWRLATLAPDGAGTSTTWTGDNNDIADTFPDDTTFVASTTAEEVEQFTVSNLSVTAAALDVEAVAVAARGRNAVTGPQNIQLSVRTGGSDFFSSTLSLSTGFTPELAIFTQNPNTASAWTSVQVNALEIGVKSKP